MTNQDEILCGRRCRRMDGPADQVPSSVHATSHAPTLVTPTPETNGVSPIQSSVDLSHTVMDDIAKHCCDNISPYKLSDCPRSFWESPTQSAAFGEHMRSVNERCINADDNDATSGRNSGQMRTKLLLWRAEEQDCGENVAMDDCDRDAGNADIQPDCCPSSSARLKSLLNRAKDERPMVITQWPDVSNYVAAMQTHLGHVTFQERCFQQLRMLGASEGGRAAIGAVGGISAVVHAMNVHELHADLQIAGFLALLDLLSNDKKNSNSFVDVNGIRTVVRSMNRHPQNLQVQQLGMVLLNRLSQFPEQIQALRNEKPGRALVEAANRFPTECQGLALKLLYKL